MATFRHTGTIHTFRDKFIDGMVANNYPRDFAERCFKQIEGFGEYGFPESHAASFALLVYISAWIKCFYPEAFCAALINSQPMGFYQPAQLVRDAREHKVEVREADINHSDWDCTLESPSPHSHKPAALRLGLRLISGLAEAEARTVVEKRNAGYTSVGGLWTRSGASLATMERLAAADTFRSIGLDRRAALWEARGLGVSTPDIGTTAKRGASAKSIRATAPLLDGPDYGDLFDEPKVALPGMAESEHVAEDYATTGLSLKAHPCKFFRNDLSRLGVITSETHRDERWRGRKVAVAGLVLVRQRPGTAKGVVFLTMEDETGIVNVIVWPKVFEANRRIVMSSQFLLVRGRLEREGLVIHVVAEELLDLTPRLGELSEGETEMPPTARNPGEGSWRSKSRDFH
jgi:error-prone DNA polymerase